MIKGFSHYNLRAPRPLLDALRDFYADVVGLAVGERPPFRSYGYWLYAGGEALLHLSECAPGETRDTVAVTTFDHVAFRCGGLQAVEDKLTAAGMAFRKTAVPQTGNVQLFLRDPAGNGVELNFAPADI